MTVFLKIIDPLQFREHLNLVHLFQFLLEKKMTSLWKLENENNF